MVKYAETKAVEEDYMLTLAGKVKGWRSLADL